MDADVLLQWEEQGTGAWHGMRNGVLVALIAGRSADGSLLWSLRNVNPAGIARAAGTANSIEDAKAAAQQSWDAWCRALGLTSS